MTIFVSGDIVTAGTLPSELGTRDWDTRHAHFTLPFSLNGSNTMTLTFADSPNPDVIEAIDVPASISGGQFSWEGDVDVNGSMQHIDMVSHAIGLADSELSVRRDALQNTKALTIDVDGAVVATYDEDGSVAEGPGVSKEIQ